MIKPKQRHQITVAAAAARGYLATPQRALVHARWSAVFPWRLVMEMSQPAAMSALVAPTCPPSAARCRGLSDAARGEGVGGGAHIWDSTRTLVTPRANTVWWQRTPRRALRGSTGAAAGALSSFGGALLSYHRSRTHLIVDRGIHFRVLPSTTAKDDDTIAAKLLVKANMTCLVRLVRFGMDDGRARQVRASVVTSPLPRATLTRRISTSTLP